MLVLTRKKNESIVIGDNIEITVVDIQGSGTYRHQCAQNISIHRKEIYLEIQSETKAADIKDKSKGFVKEQVTYCFTIHFTILVFRKKYKLILIYNDIKKKYFVYKTFWAKALYTITKTESIKDG